jgi:protein-S-isoprenylcysteine O-methyltransferase Ste14
MWVVADFGPFLPVPDIVRISAGALFFAAGVAVAVAGVISFRRAETTVNPLKPESATSLVSTGVFAVTRNPMYLGLLLALVGWAMYLAAPVPLIGPVGFWLYIDRFQIVPEERALKKLFGNHFDEYAANVRRWL